MRPGLLSVLATAGLAVAGCGPDGPAARAPSDVAGAHARFAAVAEPSPAPQGRHRTARVRRPTPLRRRPGGRLLGRIGRRTEFGSPSVLAVTARRGGWLRVVTPLLPNGRPGWIRARDVRLGSTGYDIRVDRSRRRAVLRRGGRAVLRFAVAVGRPGNETPLGRFAVTDKLRPQDPASPYGCCIVALSGHQTRLVPGWPGGDRLAIHHTPAASSVGRPASLGCLRARERAMRRLLRRVPLGAPVRIVA